MRFADRPYKNDRKLEVSRTFSKAETSENVGSSFWYGRPQIFSVLKYEDFLFITK